MAYQTSFKRYELKYILTMQQRDKLLREMSPYMAEDQYGHSAIRNIYFDTDTYRLVRTSLDKPQYKEKLRVRSYCKAKKTSPVFVELKKKYKSVVYKRRLALTEQEAMDWLCTGSSHPPRTQIADEIDYFCRYYDSIHPVAFLSYERDAFYSLSGDDFRITFDENILCREQELSLEAELWGTPLLERDQVLMEIKTPGSIPLWMTHFLTRQQLYRTSFSKYGTAYQDIISKNLLGGKIYA